jgi:hypothetical protein
MALLDSTLRPICFGIDPLVTKGTTVGAEKFKRYEHALYVMGEIARIAYCDTGIGHLTIQKSLGLSPDIVNKVISAYDAKYKSEKSKPITSQPGLGSLPMESYSLVPSPNLSSKTKWGTYVSSSDDMTCYFLNASKIKANPNSIFGPTDVIVSFKGSSTVDNFKHDLMSQFTAKDLQKLVEPIGIKIDTTVTNFVTGSFVNPLVKAWTQLMRALEEHVTNTGATRLFITGQSLGGAYCELFAFILAEGKVSGTIPIMSKINSIHIVSFGAPCILGDGARNTFNRHLDSKLVTFDRVVSQAISARSAATQLFVGGVAGPNDVIPTIPAGFAHPGFRPLANEFKPEANGRPYGLDNVRKFYGVESSSRYRDPKTWPFEHDLKYGDFANKAELNKIVKDLIGLEAPDTSTEVPALIKDAVPAAANTSVAPAPQTGGLFGGLFGIGSEKTKYETATKSHIPNFLSVQGNKNAAAFAHAEYLGMFYFGVFRLPGMKNPGSGNNVAYFEMDDTGVKISYDPITTRGGYRRRLKTSKRRKHKNKRSKKTRKH